MRRLAVAISPLLVALACHDEPAPPPLPPPVPIVAPAPPPPPPEPVPVPLSDPPQPPPEPEPDDGKETIAALTRELSAGLSSKRNRARLARMLEAARRDDRPMLRRVLAEAEARAGAGAPDAMEWKTVMNRLEDHVNDDPEPVVADAWDRIAEERKRVESASADERARMWQQKNDEQARIDTMAGETFGTPGTRLNLNKPGEGTVERRVFTDEDGELALEEE